MSQYSEFADRAVQVNKSEFEEFDFTAQRLDTFLQKHIGQVSSLSRLQDVVKSLESFTWASKCRKGVFYQPTARA